MFAAPHARKAAPVLACAGVRLRFRLRPNAFGNALGGYFAQELGSSGSQQEEKALQAREDARDAAMAGLFGAGAGTSSVNLALSFAQDTQARKQANNPLGLPTQWEEPAVAGTGLRLGRASEPGLRITAGADTWNDRPLREAMQIDGVFDDGYSAAKTNTQKQRSDTFGSDWELTQTGGNARSNARYRSGSIVELAKNTGRDGVIQGLDDITGFAALLGDYRVLGNSMQLRAQVGNMQGELGDIRKDLFALGKKPPLETTDLMAPGDGVRVLADKLTEHRNYVRLVAYEKMGVLTLNDDLSIRTIGKDRLTPDEFLKELGRVAERSVAAGAREADALAKSGDLPLNRFYFGDSAEAVAKGNVVDRRYKFDVSDWLANQRVPEGAFGIVSINRRFTDEGDPTNYRIPDVLVNYGPQKVYALDATLGTKTSSTPQVRDSLRYGVTQWGNVTRNGLDWIYNSNNVRIRR